MESDKPASSQAASNEHTDSAEPRRAAITNLFRRIDGDGRFDFDLDRDTRLAEDREPLDWNEQ